MNLSTHEFKRAYDKARYLRLKAERQAREDADPITTIPETTIAYLAGLTDGDGSIYVTHTNRLKTYYPGICWAMTDRDVIDWIAGLLKAKTVVQNNHTNRRRGTTTWGASVFKVQWRTGLTGRRAQMLCARMLPYLHTKHAQAVLVCEFPVDARSAPGVFLAPEIAERRIDLGQQISRLNH